ncbi:hypothetical protein CEXT_6441 [Caerostris extrusa]|uniref:Uncharacterized protein n=1 Tax=Caerostris extrusa TaxID=172846 RepID=A0AAV4U4P8_CAEEX|nr:hypothetical protein CEXT_6441 [Caerostris extrusa]
MGEEKEKKSSIPTWMRNYLDNKASLSRAGQLACNQNCYWAVNFAFPKVYRETRGGLPEQTSNFLLECNGGHSDLWKYYCARKMRIPDSYCHWFSDDLSDDAADYRNQEISQHPLTVTVHGHILTSPRASSCRHGQKKERPIVHPRPLHSRAIRTKEFRMEVIT